MGMTLPFANTPSWSKTPTSSTRRCGGPSRSLALAGPGPVLVDVPKDVQLAARAITDTGVCERRRPG